MVPVVIPNRPNMLFNLFKFGSSPKSVKPRKASRMTTMICPLSHPGLIRVVEMRNAGELRLLFVRAADYTRGQDPMRAQTRRITGAGAEGNYRNCGSPTRRRPDREGGCAGLASQGQRQGFEDRRYGLQLRPPSRSGFCLPRALNGDPSPSSLTSRVLPRFSERSQKL